MIRLKCLVQATLLICLDVNAVLAYCIAYV